eukprot:12245695-Prorocentrum_lima.AAC.1
MDREAAKRSDGVGDARMGCPACPSKPGGGSSSCCTGPCRAPLEFAGSATLGGCGLHLASNC